jgi:hypothetical protein
MRRALFLGGEWQGDFVALLITGVILVPASVAVFAYVMKLVKTTGTLSQY